VIVDSQREISPPTCLFFPFANLIYFWSTLALFTSAFFARPVCRFAKKYTRNSLYTELRPETQNLFGKVNEAFAPRVLLLPIQWAMVLFQNAPQLQLGGSRERATHD
jgi:hypothetical protein